MEPVRLGVIGCGVIGPTHMKPAMESPDIELVAVADLIEERANTAAEKFGAKKIYIEGSDLIADPEIEAVVLAMPAYARKDLALKAFAAGKHVLTEKPVGMCADDIAELIAARGDLVAACCSARYRFPEGARVATECVASGALGQLREVYHRSFFPAPPPPASERPQWRLKRHLNGGGFLMNWGCYDLDYLLGICGWQLKPEKCFGQTWQIPSQLRSHIPEGSDAETHYTALIRCEGGTILSIERGEYMPTDTENAWHIIGEKGSLRLTMVAKKPKQIIFTEATEDAGATTKVLWESDDEGDISLIHDGPTLDFCAAIREGRQPNSPLEKAIMVQRITDAVYKSAATGEAVSV